MFPVWESSSTGSFSGTMLLFAEDGSVETGRSSTDDVSWVIVKRIKRNERNQQQPERNKLAMAQRFQTPIHTCLILTADSGLSAALYFINSPANLDINNETSCLRVSFRSSSCNFFCIKHSHHVHIYMHVHTLHTHTHTWQKEESECSDNSQFKFRM